MNVMKRRCGLSFIEVMVTVCILAFGLSAIYQAFFVSLDYLNHATYRTYALNFLNNKVALIQQHYQLTNTLDVRQGDHLAEIFIKGRKFRFNSEIVSTSLPSMPGLRQLDIKVLWQERKRLKQITRSVYIYKKFDAKEP
jgi:Tfp pilus assembly protein PilE